MTGLVIQVISEFYDVLLENHKIYRCQIKGILKINVDKVLVGDHVLIEITDENLKQGLITNILPRKNVLLRPTVSNIDQVIIVSSIKQPNFSSLLLNKYLIWVEANNLNVILAFTKADLGISNETLEKINAYQNLGYRIVILSQSDNLTGWNTLRKWCTSKISILSGQTGVGKSSILNVFDPNLKLRTQEISQALNRGKHTTTANRLLLLNGDIKIIDAPGFSAFNLDSLDLKAIATSFHFFKKWSLQCEFKGCLHIYEVHCAVKQALDQRLLPNFIYEDYLKIVKQYEIDFKRKGKKWNREK